MCHGLFDEFSQIPNLWHNLVEAAVAKPPFRECYRGNILRHPALLMGAGKLKNFGNNLVQYF